MFFTMILSPSLRPSQIFLVLMLILNGFAYAKTMDGVKVKDVIRLSPETDPIQLNGASAKKKAAHTIYIGGLYLQNERHSLDDILADNGPKRFLFYCRTGKISPETMIKSFDQGMTINNSKETLKKIKTQINDFHQIWRNMVITKGDEIWIDYLPSEGTRVSINGEVKAKIDGKDFYNAFLRAWLGKYPMNAKIKHALLGKKTGS